MQYKLCTAVALFSDRLKSDAEFEIRGEAASQRVFQILRQHRNDVAAVKVYGSTGKRCGARHRRMQDPDFEVAVFFTTPNPHEFTHPENGPPFGKILREFQEIFNPHFETAILTSSNPNFIRIQINGVKLDISAAILFGNIGTLNRLAPAPAPENIQRKNTLELISSLSSPGKFGHFYSPGLASASLGYVRKEAARLKANPLIRLAKFWISGLRLPPALRVGYIARQSYLMKIMALYAAQQLHQDYIYLFEHSLISFVEKFLQLMCVFRSLEICHPWSWRWMSRMKEENPEMRPIILDPVNPFNNLARLHPDPRVRREIIKCIEEGADHCLEKLKIVKWRGKCGWDLQSVNQVKNILDQSTFNSNWEEPIPVQRSVVPFQMKSEFEFESESESECQKEDDEGSRKIMTEAEAEATG